MKSEIEVIWNEDDIFVQADVKGEEEVFTAKTTSFLITDDLRMFPNVDKSIIQSIKDLGLMYADGAKQLIVTIGFNEIMEMLKLSLLSKTPLTDLIFPTKAKSEQFSETYEGANSISEKFKEQFSLPPADMNEGANSSSEKFKVKATLHKSTRKLLFVQAEEDFIDFLFSLLTIPVGKVGSLLGGNTSLGSIDNLYSSLASLNAVKFLKTTSIKNMLLDPELPPQYLSKNQILSLSEQKPRDLYYHAGNMGCKEYLSPSSTSMLSAFYVDPKGEGCYVRGPRMYMVTDDLTITPLCMLSTISTLDELKIPFFDVEEVELNIGLVEGLNILKASLTSTSALTDALILIQKKYPKQEEE
ncbi:hypothetical protein ACJIZ3_019229 [Penstemon smallii]|uniref:DUF674 family protein n=1 Tax=Penstemon smallii TaxID=265156 RepID=A0ABD3T0P0_9LAMI